MQHITYAHLGPREGKRVSEWERKENSTRGIFPFSLPTRKERELICMDGWIHGDYLREIEWRNFSRLDTRRWNFLSLRTLEARWRREEKGGNKKNFTFFHFSARQQKAAGAAVYTLQAYRFLFRFSLNYIFYFSFTISHERKRSTSFSSNRIISSLILLFFYFFLFFAGWCWRGEEGKMNIKYKEEKLRMSDVSCLNRIFPPLSRSLARNFFFSSVLSWRQLFFPIVDLFDDFFSRYFFYSFPTL